MSSAEQLTLTLLSSRSRAAPWSQDSWLLGVPQWAEDPQVAGALARLPVPTRQLSEATVKKRARRVLDTQGDRGWGELLVLLEHPTRLPTAEYWVAHRRQIWPPTLVRWPEERVRALTFFMRVNQVINIEDGVALFETVETREELTLARWLTGRAWAKGARVVEVMDAAELSLKDSPRHTGDLWHEIVKDKRAWLKPHHIAEIDKNTERDCWAWFRALTLERRYHT